jgi:hypothetical protein
MNPYLILFSSVFITLFISAIICQIILYLASKKIRAMELRIIDRYNSKIDKIPAILSVLQKHSAVLWDYTELRDLHRKALISPASTIYDLLELNEHISERFGFLMRLALKVKEASRDGNFITIREKVTRIEWQMRELMREHVQLTRTYNSIHRARDYTIFWAVLPGRRRHEIFLPND